MSYKIEYDIDLDKSLAKIPKHDAKFIKEKIERQKRDTNLYYNELISKGKDAIFMKMNRAPKAR